MARLGDKVTWLTLPFRGGAHRVALLFFLSLSSALLVLGKFDLVLVERLRIVVADAVAPVVDVLSQPIRAGQRTVDNIRGHFALHSENARLIEENARLHQWYGVALRLEQENNRLTELLKVPTNRVLVVASPRVIAHSAGPFVRSVLLNAGTRDGVTKGVAAVNEKGVVGRVVSAGRRSSRLLLLTDLNSRVPVNVGRVGDHAILAGDNSAEPDLIFLPVNAHVRAGDRVVTSGHGGVFPPDMPVGVVRVEAPGQYRVQLFGDLERLRVVRLLQVEPLSPPELSPGGRAADKKP